MLSPFAANISLKKTPTKDKSGIPLPVRTRIRPKDDSVDEVAALKEKNLKLENELLQIKQEYEIVVDDCETTRQLLNTLQLKPEPCMRDSEEYKNVIANFKAEVDHLRTVIENQKHEIKELSTHNKIKKEVVNNLNKKISESKTKHNNEKMEVAKTHKAEIKYWRKLLGEETKINVKLREKLQDESKTYDQGKKPKRSKAVKAKNVETTEENDSDVPFCSICSLNINNYIPEYFCGERFNPACESCKDRDGFWATDDHFSSFPSSSQPSSLVSHWLLQHETIPPQNPSSISSLVSHCVRLPNPGDTFITVEEAINMMRAEMEIRRAEMKSWFSQMLTPLSNPNLEGHN